MGWKGMGIEVGKETIHVDTVYDVLDKLCRVPERPISAPMRMPISGIYKIKGVGDVLAGRVEQGVVKPGEEVVFLPATRRRILALARCSPWRCTTRASTSRTLATTSASISRVWIRTTCRAL